MKVVCHCRRPHLWSWVAALRSCGGIGVQDHVPATLYVSIKNGMIFLRWAPRFLKCFRSSACLRRWRCRNCRLYHVFYAGEIRYMGCRSVFQLPFIRATYDTCHPRTSVKSPISTLCRTEWLLKYQLAVALRTNTGANGARVSRDVRSRARQFLREARGSNCTAC